MTEDRWFAKEPCQHCPFRRDVHPFLHPERAEEIAGSAWNPYSEFHCHKTLEHDDEEGDTFASADSLICAGFLSMQINEAGIDAPEGFTQSDAVYSDSWEMIDAYTDAWDERFSKADSGAESDQRERHQ